MENQYLRSRNAAKRSSKRFDYVGFQKKIPWKKFSRMKFLFLFLFQIGSARDMVKHELRVTSYELKA